MNLPPASWTITNPSRRWGIISVTLLLVAGACLWVGLRGHEVLLAAPARHPSSLATSSTSTTPVTTRSVPVSLRIPALGVAVAVSTLGLNPDGTVEVPTDFQKPGWYRLGPSPGQMGSAVILGHVDSYQGPAVFFRLQSLAAGDPVEVTLADGVVADFVVTSVAMYPKDQFPSQQVYGSHGNRALQLVTCGGTFDTRTRSYLSNIVVYTSLQAVTGVSHQPTQR
jgi:sortase (surface protein transpeptidase)